MAIKRCMVIGAVAMLAGCAFDSPPNDRGSAGRPAQTTQTLNKAVWLIRNGEAEVGIASNLLEGDTYAGVEKDKVLPQLLAQGWTVVPGSNASFTMGTVQGTLVFLQRTITVPAPDPNLPNSPSH